MSASLPVLERWLLHPHTFQLGEEMSRSDSSAASPPSPNNGTSIEELRVVMQAAPAGDASSPTHTTDLWRCVELHHAGVLLPASALGRICIAMDAAAVPLALVSLPGRTLILFPATHLGRALATLYQSGVVSRTG